MRFAILTVSNSTHVDHDGPFWIQDLSQENHMIGLLKENEKIDIYAKFYTEAEAKHYYSKHLNF